MTIKELNSKTASGDSTIVGLVLGLHWGWPWYGALAFGCVMGVIQGVWTYWYYSES